MRSLRAVLTAGLVAALVATLLPATSTAAETAYDATVRRTSHGIPHITGDDFGDVGFGFGYAHAQDNICTLADIYVTVNGERSKYFGPEETWTFRGNGTVNTNLDSDFFYTAINESGAIEDLLAQDPPHGPLPGVREGVAGYVAGYNAYLEEVGGPDGISDPRCQGAEWVRPITEIDAYRRFFQLASLASTGVAIDWIGGAQPPTPPVTEGDDGGDGDGSAGASSSTSASSTSASSDARDGDDEMLQRQLEMIRDGLPERFHEALGIGSNAYGLGAEATVNGRGMVLGNPHFPWHGGERLYQHHLTIPGEVDVAGASLYGVPLVLIGHTDGVAWSHTVSTAFRFTPFELTLVPGSPTTYLVDGAPREMDRITVEVEARQDDGSNATEERTLYSTEYGPVMTGILDLPLFPWTPAKAFAMGDANHHMRYLNHFFEINQAQSTAEVKDILERFLGIPWVNTIAADRDGRGYYADIGSIPNVPDDHAQQCNSVLGQATFEALRLPVLDGSRSDCGWLSDDDAVAEGVFGPSNLPDLFRDDYVTNSNDSYWLSNPDEPITGYATIIGDEETARTLRTRLGLRMVIERLAGEDGYDGAGFTREILQDVVFNNRQHAGELTRDAAVEMCRSFPGGQAPSSSGPVAVEQDGVNACDVLERWDLRDDLDSNGAILFRRFWAHASGASPSPWVNGFDADDPVNTPNTLNTSHPQVESALGDAINDLVGAEIPLDAPLRGWQYEDRGDGEQIPIHGGPGGLSLFNAINVVWDGDPSDGAAGYPDVAHGSSFVMAAHFVDGPCPVDAGAIVTYSQSEDVTSPWFKDQTRMYTDKQWNDMPFCEDEIAADPNLTITTVTAEAPTGGTGDGPDDGAVDAAPDTGAHTGAVAGSPLPATGGGLALLALVLLGAGIAVARWGRRT